jgi:hypothetical protein
MLYKYRTQKLFWFFIFLFYNGLFSYYGKDIQNLYRVGLVCFAFYAIVEYGILKVKENMVSASFFLFSAIFIFTAFWSDDSLNIIFSQYSRYFIMFIVFLIISRFRGVESFRTAIFQAVYDLLFIQIGLALFKYLLIGIIESVVGTISYQGGAMATSLPMLGFMYLWTKRNGKFDRKDWIFIAGLMFIGFVSIKRTIWFIMPILISLFMFYIPGRKISPRFLLFSILLVPLVFYAGVRLNPTLNRENKVGGSFDLDFTINYAKFYMYGDGIVDRDKNKIYGRGGATTNLIGNLVEGNISREGWFGYGLTKMYATNYEEFEELGFGLNHKGSATGIFQTLITNGYIGIFFLLYFAYTIIAVTANKKLMMVLFAFFAWEYFFYTGIVLREPALSFLLVFIILFSPKNIHSTQSLAIK